ncbi:MAG: hypothetical protein ACC682_16340 [Gemmatimonadota bacterium]
MSPAIGRIVALALLAACASPGPFDDKPGTVQVEVDNLSLYHATVYLTGSAGYRRLGMVHGRSEKTFVARLRFTTGVRLKVRLLADRSFTTETMYANPGEKLWLIIPSGLRQGRQLVFSKKPVAVR